MILVTGATGKTGIDVVRGPSIVGAGARAFIRDPAKAQSLRRPGVEIAAGAPAWLADSVVALYGVFAANHAAAVSPVVEELTGYPARTFDDWARENAAAFR